MPLTLQRPLPVCSTLVVLLSSAAPAYARGEAHAAAAHTAAAQVARPATTAERINLYAPRVRRATVMYLRLRLLELREAGLERARAAIERRLSIDDLLEGPEIPLRSGGKSAAPAPRRPSP